MTFYKCHSDLHRWSEPHRQWCCASLPSPWRRIPWLGGDLRSGAGREVSAIPEGPSAQMRISWPQLEQQIPHTHIYIHTCIISILLLVIIHNTHKTWKLRVFMPWYLNLGGWREGGRSSERATSTSIAFPHMAVSGSCQHHQTTLEDTPNIIK